MRGSAAYLQIMKRPTPEIIVYGAYWLTKNDKYSDDDLGEFGKVASILKGIPASARYRACAKMIRELRRGRDPA